ncbi:MAG TPA: hypothetical protein VF815_42060 [Myxococcaceae bacterium]|jgi:hypothetical protein
MGRSYSEYPFHEQQPMLGVQGSGPRLGNDEDKQKLGQQKAALPDAPISYRQPHAETIQRLQQRRAAKKAAGSSAKGGRRVAKAPAAKKAAPARKASTAKAKPAKKAAPAAKQSTAKPSGVSAKAPARGGKVVSRVAAAARTVVGRLAKTASRKSSKNR